MLEQAITENTSAIRDLIAAISKGIPTTAAQVAAVVQESPAVEVKKPAPAPAQKAVATTPPIVAAPVAATTTEPTSAPTSPVDYETLKKAFLAIFQVNREKAVATLAKYSIAKLPEAKPEQYAEILAALQA
jgi:hypothetical protein